MVDQEKVSDMAIENLINKPAPCVEEEIVVENVNETPKETEIKTNIVAQIEDIENFNNVEDKEIFDHLKGSFLEDISQKRSKASGAFKYYQLCLWFRNFGLKNKWWNHMNVDDILLKLY